MKVKYALIGQARRSKNGNYVCDAVLNFGDEKVYVILVSSNAFDSQEGVVDVSITRLLRGKFVLVQDQQHQTDLTNNLLDDIIKR